MQITIKPKVWFNHPSFGSNVYWYPLFFSATKFAADPSKDVWAFQSLSPQLLCWLRGRDTFEITEANLNRVLEVDTINGIVKS